MTQDFFKYGITGGAYAGAPERIEELFKECNLQEGLDKPIILTHLNGEQEQWSKAIDYIAYYLKLFKQWAYRRADSNILLLQEIDKYITDFFNWLKQGREDGLLDDIETKRLIALKENLTEKLHDYIPERLINGGLKSIEDLFRDIENGEFISKYPPNPSDKWLIYEIERLSLLYEKIELLRRLITKIHPENANKYDYLFYLDKIVSHIIMFIGDLNRNRNELIEKVAAKEKINLEQHLSKLDKSIDDTNREIKRHFSELKENLVASKPLEIKEIIRTLRRYRSSKDISALPPIRQLYNTLHKNEKQYAEKTIYAIAQLGRAVRSEAGYHQYNLLEELSDDEVLSDIESRNINDNQQLSDPANATPAGAKQKADIISMGGSFMSGVKESTTEWDVFVCHASEDKKDFVRPLADALKHVGLKVWYDDFSLKTGDSLGRAIDKGLGCSQYGIVVISQNFLKKDWTQKELDGLESREVNGKKVILPIWHNIDVNAVRKYSPTLAGRKAISSTLSLDQIVKQLLVDMEVKPKRKVGIDTFHGETWGGLTNLLGDKAFELSRINSKVDTESLRPIKALIIATKGMSSDKGFEESEIDAIQGFVTNGGALLCVDLAWSWVYKEYGNKPLEQFPLNVLGKRIGFCITGKNINSPAHFSTEIMEGIQTVKRDKWVSSEIEFYGPKSQSFIMDDKDRIIAGIMPVGDGLVSVVGHRDLLVENPEIVIRILSYFAREKQWTARA